MRLPAAPQRVKNGILEICMERQKKLGSLTTEFSKLLLTNQFAATIGGTISGWRDLRPCLVLETRA
jgi:hypothetical protein